MKILNIKNIMGLLLLSQSVFSRLFSEKLLVNCGEWVVGFTRESCVSTCMEVNRTCDDTQFKNIITMDSFNAMVESSWIIGSSERPNSTEQFCNGDGEINDWEFATMPASFAYQMWVVRDSDPNNGFEIGEF